MSRWAKRSLLLLAVLLLGMVSLTNMFRSVHASNIAFNPPQNLSNSAFASDYPRIAVIGNSVYVTWLNNSLSANSDLLFTSSADNGSDFTTPISLSRSLGRGNNANEQVAASGNYVYVVWQSNATGTSNIWFDASSNKGASFFPPVNLSNSSAAMGLNPQLAASGSNVYVAWLNQSINTLTNDILFSSSTNNGGSFSINRLNLSNDKAATAPVIAASGSNIYIAWRDNSTGSYDIYLRTSNNAGSSFAAVQNLSKNPATYTRSLDQSITIAGSNVYVVWTRDVSSTPSDNTILAISNNNGATFTSPQQLTTSNKSIHPQAAASGSNVFVAWEDDSQLGYAIVTLAVSGNNGVNFNPPVMLSSPTGFSTFPQIAATGTDVYVTWPDASSPYTDVFFISSSDSGATFGSIANLSNNPGISTGPVIASVGSKVYVAWQDDTPSPGTDQILFATNLTRINFLLYAYVSGWNATGSANPTLTRFKGRSFSIQIVFKDTVPYQHNIAIYSNGTTAANVQPTDSCIITHTTGCIAVSATVSPTNTTAILSFTPIVPVTNYTGPGGYEYFCQYHPSMHGHIKVYKSPDIGHYGIVNIFDIATLALAYGSTPTSSNWNIAADLDNSGKVDIFDVAIAAFYYNQSP